MASCGWGALGCALIPGMTQGAEGSLHLLPTALGRGSEQMSCSLTRNQKPHLPRFVCFLPEAGGVSSGCPCYELWQFSKGQPPDRLTKGVRSCPEVLLIPSLSNSLLRSLALVSMRDTPTGSPTQRFLRLSLDQHVREPHQFPARGRPRTLPPRAGPDPDLPQPGTARARPRGEGVMDWARVSRRQSPLGHPSRPLRNGIPGSHL